MDDSSRQLIRQNRPDRWCPINGKLIDVPPPQRGRPRYRQVADELRRRILTGATPAGSLLPTEPQLIAEFQVSRGTVREALGLLRAEGLVVTEHGRGSYARPVLPVTRRGTERYRREMARALVEPTPAQATSFTADHGIDWSAYQLDREYREVPASTAIAELFGIKAGTMLLERRFVFRAQGIPQQMSTSNYPLDLIAGTPVADPANEPWPGGNFAQLRSLGIEVTRIVERIRARMPVPEEVETLRIPGGTPVLAITRQTFAGDRVVEVAVDMVLPADRTELEYEVDLS
jgi:GntR family transcriptional regulator